MQSAKSDLETQLEQTTAELTKKWQETARISEEKTLELQNSLELCKKLKAELSSARSSCDELKAVETRLKEHVQRAEGELAAVKDELSKQITEKEEGLKKAEVCMCEFEIRP